MIDFAADLASILSGPLGQEATYTPDGGSPVSVNVLPRGDDYAAEIEDARGIVGAAVFTVAAAAITDRPRAGDTLVVGARSWVLVDDAIEDARGRTWTLVARRT